MHAPPAWSVSPLPPSLCLCGGGGKSRLPHQKGTPKVWRWQCVVSGSHAVDWSRNSVLSSVTCGLNGEDRVISWRGAR